MEPTAFELTLEQQFQLRRMQDESTKLTPEHALELLIQAHKLLMVKDNIIRSLINGNN